MGVPAHVASAAPRKRRFRVGERVALYHVPFFALYLITLTKCYETAGNPYRAALRHHAAMGYDPAVFDAVGVGADASDGSAWSGRGEVRDEWGEGEGDETSWDAGEPEEKKSEGGEEGESSNGEEAVSYTHLTLPTILLV